MPLDAEQRAHLKANRIAHETVTARILAARPPHEAARSGAPLRGFPETDAATVAERLQAARPLAVAISHDHYPTITGGVQNCLRDEERGFRERGWRFLHLCPQVPLPTLAEPSSPERFAVIATLDGTTLGTLPLQGVLDGLARLPDEPGGRLVIVHQLLGHSPELIQLLAETLRGSRTLFWAHDLFAHCPSVHLLRNEAVFCGGPPVGSPACRICHAGGERPGHVRRLRQFFAALRPTLLAPSETILERWRGIDDLAHEGAHILPPCTIDPGPERAPGQGRLRVAFLGASFFHKGWDVFEALALWLHDDPRYEMFHFAIGGLPVPHVAFHPTDVTRDDPDAMRRAVERHGIEVVVNWSRCYESFSFTAAEALAGGAFVVARHGAGNVGPLVRAADPSRLLELATDIELQDRFVGGDIIRLARAASRWTGTLRRGAGAADLLPA